MLNPTVKKEANKINISSPIQLQIDLETYLKQKKLSTYNKILFDYNGIKIGFTKKQINILSYVAKGYSNSRIAKELALKEAAVKLLIYRLMKYLENNLYEPIDRFYLIIIAQKLNLEHWAQ